MLWIDLWGLATSVDFVLGRLASDDERLAYLSTYDSTEIALRRLASHVYYQRTHDGEGARRLLAVQPPGGQADNATAWCEEASKKQGDGGIASGGAQD